MTVKTFPVLDSSPATPEQALYIHPDADLFAIDADMLGAITSRSTALVDTLSYFFDNATGTTAKIPDETISHLLAQLYGNLELIQQIAHTAPERIRSASNEGGKQEVAEPVPEVDPNAVRAKANGRWRSVLTGHGLTLPQNKDALAPCPACGGQFRFIDEHGTGSWCCEQCGTGDGLSLLLNTTHWSKAATLALLNDWLTFPTSQPATSTDETPYKHAGGTQTVMIDPESQEVSHVKE